MTVFLVIAAGIVIYQYIILPMHLKPMCDVQASKASGGYHPGMDVPVEKELDYQRTYDFAYDVCLRDHGVR